MGQSGVVRKKFKLKSLPLVCEPNSIYYIKPTTNSKVLTYVTDFNGAPTELKDNEGTSVINNIVNTDGNLTITGTTTKTINFSTNPLNKLKQNKLLVGSIDGINSIFSIQDTIVPDSEQIYVNGILQKKPDDYNISGSLITFNFSPIIDENLTITYIKQ